MCGIAGALDDHAERGNRDVVFLNEAQRHRGPDDTALIRVERVTLGNTRLAIQDPTPAGNQPFVFENRYWCVFNGEIYNYIELIERFGLTPTQCDGPIIPELWAKHGVGGLGHLRGMFSIAIYDRESAELILVRDPLGIKPLYYRTIEDRFLFASEPRALAAIDPASSIDPRALVAFLNLGAVPQSMSTYQGISPVPPNTVLHIGADGMNEEPLGPSPIEILSGGSPNGNGVGDVFRESVMLHLRSDVPTALLLSGGFDSAAIASVAHDLGHDLNCVTVGVPGDTDESAAARRAAVRYRHAHTVAEGTIGPEAVADFFHAMQRPTIDGLNTSIVSAAIRALGIKVAVSGLGGDEALGGYSHFRLLRLLERLEFMTHLPDSVAKRMTRVGGWITRRAGSPKARRLLTEGPWSPWNLDLLQREVFDRDTATQLAGIDPGSFTYATSPSDAGELSSYEGLVLAEIALYLQTTLLPDADAFSMCHSVEMRVPFVDPAVFAAAAQAARISSLSQNKETLAKALNDDYLLSLSRGPKKGFTVPIERWMTDGTLGHLSRRVEGTDAPVWSFLDRRVAAPILRGSGRWSERWAITVLNEWLLSLRSSVADVRV